MEWQLKCQYDAIRVVEMKKRGVQSMPRKKKVPAIKATYDLIMLAPTEGEQNQLALLMKAYWQGISQGMSMAQSQKSAQGA